MAEEEILMDIRKGCTINIAVSHFRQISILDNKISLSCSFFHNKRLARFAHKKIGLNRFLVPGMN